MATTIISLDSRLIKKTKLQINPTVVHKPTIWEQKLSDDENKAFNYLAVSRLEIKTTGKATLIDLTTPAEWNYNQKAGVKSEPPMLLTESQLAKAKATDDDLFCYLVTSEDYQFPYSEPGTKIVVSFDMTDTPVAGHTVIMEHGRWFVAECKPVPGGWEIQQRRKDPQRYSDAQLEGMLFLGKVAFIQEDL